MFKKKKDNQFKTILAIVGVVATLGGTIFGICKMIKRKKSEDAGEGNCCWEEDCMYQEEGCEEDCCCGDEEITVLDCIDEEVETEK